jgi:hypothetical protein
MACGFSPYIQDKMSIQQLRSNHSMSTEYTQSHTLMGNIAHIPDLERFSRLVSRLLVLVVCLEQFLLHNKDWD